MGLNVKSVFPVLMVALISGTAFAQGAPPKVGDRPIVQIKPRAAAGRADASPLIGQLRACLSIEDVTKERLDCYDAIVTPEPKPNSPAAKIIRDCRFLKEEDQRLACFNGFLVEPPPRPSKRVSAPKVKPH